MDCKEVAELLLKTPGAKCLMQYRGEWVEVCGVASTGEHRNAMTLLVENPNLGGGVITVAPDR